MFVGEGRDPDKVYVEVSAENEINVPLALSAFRDNGVEVTEA